MPGSLLSQYSLSNAGSVPAFWVTRYCSGVSRETASGSLRKLSVISSSFAGDQPAGCGLSQQLCNLLVAPVISAPRRSRSARRSDRIVGGTSRAAGGGPPFFWLPLLGPGAFGARGRRAR